MNGRRRKKRGNLGLRGIEVKPLAQSKTTGEKLILVATHLGATVVGAAGGSLLGRGGFGASVATIATAAFMAPSSPILSSHLIAAGGGMMAGPALVAQKGSSLSGFDFNSELDLGVERVNTFFRKGVSKSLWLDRIMPSEAPAGTIEEEAQKIATRNAELGGIQRIALPTANRETQHRAWENRQNARMAEQQFEMLLASV